MNTHRDASLRRSRVEFGDSIADMIDLMDALGGWPDVDLWAGSTIREWYQECQDGREMVAVLRRLGAWPEVHPLATADEIRAAVSYADVLRVAQEAIIEEFGR